MTQQSNENNIPKHWQIKKLGEVCQVLDNLRKPINSTERQQRIAGKRQSELYPYFGATGQVGWIDDYMTDGQYILIGEDGAPFLDIYKDKAYKITGKTWVNNHAHILKGKDNVISDDFALYYLNSINYTDFVNGTTRLKLTKSNLVDIPVVLPPLSEQLVLVSKIEELLSDLENGKQQLLTAQQQLKVYRQSLLKAAFEGRLTSTSLSEQKEGELPKGWKWVKIDSLLFDRKKGMSTGPFGTMLKKSEHQTSGIPVLGIENIGEGTFQMPNKIFITPQKAEELKNFRVQENDIIISRSGTVGEICLLPKKMENSIISTNLIRVRLNQDVINPKFFVYLFQGGKVRQQVFVLCKGSSRAFLNQTILNSLDFPYCSLREQQLVIDELESKLTVCDKIEETIAQSLQQAETLKQSILKKAFEGKLVSVEEEKVNTKLPNIQLQFPKIVDNITTTDLHAGIISMVIAAHEKNTHYLNRLNHVKCEKIAHMVEAKIGLSLGREPVKDAAGPDDYNHLTKVEHRANMANWFGCKKMGIGRTYYSKSGINNLIDKVRNTLKSEELNEIDKLIMTFLPFELEHAELIATIYAGWNNLLLYGQNPTDEEIVIESRENWSDRKLTIERDKFFKTLNWMRLHGFIPEGKGKLVLKNEKVTKTKKRNL